MSKTVWTIPSLSSVYRREEKKKKRRGWARWMLARQHTDPAEWWRSRTKLLGGSRFGKGAKKKKRKKVTIGRAIATDWKQLVGNGWLLSHSYSGPPPLPRLFVFYFILFYKAKLALAKTHFPIDLLRATHRSSLLCSVCQLYRLCCVCVCVFIIIFAAPSYV